MPDAAHTIEGHLRYAARALERALELAQLEGVTITAPELPELTELAAALSGVTVTRAALRFDPPHGGYQGEVIAHDEYLRCIECGGSFPLESMADNEPCDYCSGALAIVRANPAPESTLRLQFVAYSPAGWAR